jgi:hypothetical protein
MSDRRKLFRNRVYYGGLIAFNARQSTLDCVVRNYSPFGAKIELDHSAILPDEVDFAVPRKGMSCVARLAWRDRDTAGLVFSDKPEASGVIPLEWARKLRASERINKQLQARIAQLRSEH